MKKFTFLLVMMLAFAGFTMAQTIENFESIKMDMFAQGTNSSIGVVPNSDTVSNHSLYCGKYVVGPTGRNPWAGWSTDFPNDSVDVNVTQYVHVKIWKSFISPVDVKLEHGPGNTQTNNLWPMSDPTTHSNSLTSHWEELVFDLKSGADPIKTGNFSRFTLIPDFTDQTTSDTIYFDNIYFNNDPTVGSAPVRVLENFETIPMTRLSDDNVNDLSSFSLLKNPDPSGINKSDYVLDFLRDKDAVSWTGFWAPIADSVDVTTNKYVHVKLWKTRISEVKFKLQDGPAGTLEIASMNTQTKINGWEDFVFNFKSKTGKYHIIDLILDNSADVLASDSHIYVDDIMISKDSTQLVSLTLNVDMHGSGLHATDTVYVAGTFPSWVAPGGDLAFRMTDPDGDSIYSLTMIVPAGHKEFKFFKNAGWAGGEWNAGANRMLELAGDAVVNVVWGQAGFVGTRQNPLADKIQMYPNPVRNELNINSTADVRRVIITNTLGKVVSNINYTDNQTISTSDFSRGLYFVTFINADGTKVTQKLIKN